MKKYKQPKSKLTQQHNMENIQTLYEPKKNTRCYNLVNAGKQTIHCLHGYQLAITHVYLESNKTKYTLRTKPPPIIGHYIYNQTQV